LYWLSYNYIVRVY